MHAQYLFLAATFAISTFATPLPASSQAHVARNDESYNTRQLLEMVERDIADTEVREVEQKRQFIKGNNRISRDVEEDVEDSAEDSVEEDEE